MLVQQTPRLVAADPLLHGDQPAARHQLLDRLRRVRGEADIAIGKDADQPAAALGHNGDAGYPVVGHQLQGIGQGLVRVDGDRVHHHAGLESLDPANLLGLPFDVHVLVNDPDAAHLGHGDRHVALGDGVHGGRDQRNAEFDTGGQPGPGIGLAGQDPRFGRLQENIVECQAFVQ